MSIEKITEVILADAEKTAKATLDKAEAESREIIAVAEKKAEKLIEETGVKGIDEKEKLISRKKAVAEIDGRKIILEAKQQLISECFEKATEKIISMEKADYLEFLAAIVKTTDLTEGELIFNKKEAAEIGPDLVKYLNEDLPGSKISLSSETRNIRGGLVLKNGAIYMNGTIEALMEEAKETLTGEVAQVLFQ